MNQREMAKVLLAVAKAQSTPLPLDKAIPAFAAAILSAQVRSTISREGLRSFLAGAMDQKRRPKKAEENCRFICI